MLPAVRRCWPCPVSNFLSGDCIAMPTILDVAREAFLRPPTTLGARSRIPRSPVCASPCARSARPLRICSCAEGGGEFPAPGPVACPACLPDHPPVLRLCANVRARHAHSSEVQLDAQAPPFHPPDRLSHRHRRENCAVRRGHFAGVSTSPRGRAHNRSWDLIAS